MFGPQGFGVRAFGRAEAAPPPALLSAAIALLAAAPAAGRPAQAGQPAPPPENPSVVRVTTPLGAGSGFLVRADGLVMTAHHVVAGAWAAWVHFPGGSVCAVRGVAALDVERDLAVLKVDASDLPQGMPVVPLGDGRTAAAGAPITTVGYPEGGPQRTTAGTVLAAASALRGAGDLQLRAAIRPGCSGGPVLRADGQAIGVVVGGMAATPSFASATALEGPSALPPPDRRVLSLTEAAAEGDSGPAQAYARGLSALDFWHARSGKCIGAKAAVRVALSSFRAVTEAWPGCAMAWYDAGICCRTLGKFDEGIEALREAVRLSPGSFAPHGALSSCYSRARRLREAEEETRCAIRLAPDFAWPHLSLADVWSRRRAHRAALGEALVAVRLEPQDLEARLDAALICGRLHRYPTAIRQLRAALRIKPDCVSAHYGIAVCSRALGDRAQAWREFRAVREIDSMKAARLAERLRRADRWWRRHGRRAPVSHRSASRTRSGLRNREP